MEEKSLGKLFLLKKIFARLVYLAKSHRRHGIHSPFVYKFSDEFTRFKKSVNRKRREVLIHKTLLNFIIQHYKVQVYNFIEQKEKANSHLQTPYLILINGEKAQEHNIDLEPYCWMLYIPNEKEKTNEAPFQLIFNSKATILISFFDCYLGIYLPEKKEPEIFYLR